MERLPSVPAAATSPLTEAAGPDQITVLRHPRSLMAKIWRADGTITSYDRAKHFRYEVHKVGNIGELSKLLTKLERDQHACVIRGRYVGNQVAQSRDLDFRSGTVRRMRDYFDDQPLHVFMVDIDDFAPIIYHEINEAQMAIQEFVEAELPVPFHCASYHWALSNRAGHPDNAQKLKAHIWFWLETPYTSAALQEWVRAVRVRIDAAVFNPVQVHYTAAPVFESGVADPVPVRSGFVKGTAGDAVPLVIDLTRLASVAVKKGAYAVGRGQRLGDLHTSDPIAQRLTELGQVKSSRADGGLNIVCPFAEEHTSDSCETSTIYYLPNPGGFEQANFKCMHAHCVDRPRREFLLKLSEDPDPVRQAEVLVRLEGDPSANFEVIESAPQKLSAQVIAATPPTRPAFPEPFRGPMSAAVRAALAAAQKEQPELATFAVLAGMAACCPGHYSTHSGLRPNLYVCGVAETGAGKEVPRNVAIEIARAGGAKVIGRPASGEAIEDQLQPRVPMLCEVDEVAHMLAAVNGSKAPSHLISLSSNMLKLFTASHGTYHTRVRALARNVPLPRSVAHPCFNLMGFTTPAKLGESVTFGNIADGLLGRMLMAIGREHVVPRRSTARFSLPEEVSAVAQQIRIAVQTVGLGDQGSDILIHEGPGTGEYLDRLVVELDQRANASNSVFARSLLVRSYEKVERIAAVLAIWDRPREPVIDPEHVAWAHLVVLASDAALLDFAEIHMHEGQVQADASRVMDVLGKVLVGRLKPETSTEAEMLAEGWAPYSLVLKRCKLDARRYSDALQHLAQMDRIIMKSIPRNSRSVRVLQLAPA